jgi:hypothetical protein
MIEDPRTFPASVDPSMAGIVSMATSALNVSGTAFSDPADRALTRQFADCLRRNDSKTLIAALDAAPSIEVRRYLWQRCLDAWSAVSEPPSGSQLAAALFTVPLVLVAGSDAGHSTPGVDAVLADPDAVTTILREGGALGGCRTLAIAPCLAGAEAVAIEAWPRLLQWQASALDGRSPERAIAPASIVVSTRQETAHLRFLVGCALAAPGARLFEARDAAAWGMDLARGLHATLRSPGITLLALARPAAIPPLGWSDGLEAQRSVAAQLFAVAALRALRSQRGEPTAVVSAHRAADATGGGELRLSLSSPFDERPADGLRYPLLPFETVRDALATLEQLLRDCRVDDVRIAGGVHPDLDAVTGERLLFRADAVPDALPLH